MYIFCLCIDHAIIRIKEELLKSYGTECVPFNWADDIIIAIPPNSNINDSQVFDIS